METNIIVTALKEYGYKPQRVTDSEIKCEMMQVQATKWQQAIPVMTGCQTQIL